MTTTYQMIKSLPAKGFDWGSFLSTLRAEYVELCAANRRVTRVSFGKTAGCLSPAPAPDRQTAVSGTALESFATAGTNQIVGTEK